MSTTPQKASPSLHSIVTVMIFILIISAYSIAMGDFQQFEQDFYQSGYYIDDQGQVAYDYGDGYDHNPEYEDE